MCTQLFNPKYNVNINCEFSFVPQQIYLTKYYKDHQLTQTDTMFALMYGLPKIHKIDFPLRPIISLANSPTYMLAKIIADQLRLVFPRTRYSVDNSFIFKKLLNQIKVPPNFVMVSFDAKSLFTNVTLKHVIESIERRSLKILHESNIPPTEIISALKFIYENNYFICKDKIHRQKDSSPVGSPVSPIVADFVLEDLENFCLNALKHLFSPILSISDMLMTFLLLYLKIWWILC